MYESVGGNARRPGAKNPLTTLPALCADGYAERILLAHDASCCLDWIPDMNLMQEQVPNWHFNHIPDDVVPALKEAGVTDAQIDDMLIKNPKTLFDQTEAY